MFTHNNGHSLSHYQLQYFCSLISLWKFSSLPVQHSKKMNGWELWPLFLSGCVERVTLKRDKKEESTYEVNSQTNSNQEWILKTWDLIFIKLWMLSCSRNSLQICSGVNECTPLWGLLLCIQTCSSKWTELSHPVFLAIQPPSPLSSETP